jgi:ATP synthase protein I
MFGNTGSGRGNFRKIAAISSLGLTLPSSIAVGLFFGYVLDKLLDTGPWLLLLFLGLGIVSGFYSLIRGLRSYERTGTGSQDNQEENNTIPPVE